MSADRDPDKIASRRGMGWNDVRSPRGKKRVKAWTRRAARRAAKQHIRAERSLIHHE